MDTIELIEGTDTPIPRAGLTNRVARALAADPRFSLTFPAPGTDLPYRLRSLGWAGHFPVEDSLIVVTPRQPLEIVFEMLDSAYGLRRFQRFAAVPDTAAIDGQFQSTVSILAEHVQDRVRRGLYRHHVDRVEDLCFGPGPAESGGKFAKLVRQDPYLRCRYDERTADLQDNQILLWALYAASKARLKDAAVDQAVRLGYRALAGSLDLSDENANYSIDQFYRRLDAARPLPALCRLLLEHTGPGLPAGGSEFVPFAINMPTLFRAFVVRWLATNLPNKYRLLARYAARLQANGLLDVKVEMVIEYRASERPSMVLDTNYQNEAGLSTDAVQQAAAAAGNVGAAVAVLVYPSAPQNNSPIKADTITVRSAGFDLDRPLADAGNDFLKQIRLTD